MLPEPVEVIVVVPMGDFVQVVGRGVTTGQAYSPVLSKAQIASLQASAETPPFDGDARLFRLGIEAMRLGLAYEYDPYFSLSISRVDPLPHQLEAVYDYFLKLPRIRFLLADDPGAGKTIMAGLLIKELKIRGLVKRILIVTPASLSFQWQRELREKFRESFEVIRGDVLRANYGSNPWQDKDQVVTSVSWVSRVDDARESLLRSRWDLVIVDEAHKMSAAATDKKTLAYELGEALSEMTDHFLLMTATPHKGDADHFRLFLQLLDKDVYADIGSLEEAMRVREAPFYLRRVKEALVTFPDPDTGEVRQLFTRRIVRTTDFQIDDEEGELYYQLTRYVDEQSVQAAADESARGRALSFTMAMLQRRFASSVYAVRRSLERMRDKREKILADPEGYREAQIQKRMPEEFDELPDDEQEALLQEFEAIVGNIDPAALRSEIADLGRLIDQARRLESREVESKLVALRQLLKDQGVFASPKMKLLIFTEHKDTLDYLMAKLDAWGLTTTQIHGGMKIGDRDTPGTRLHAERAFRESCQVLVATEAAGEGINLQFCWLMVNYDIPWNPVRLEQRMGRIHRYLQDKDCLIFNFVATNTREGRVLGKLFERLAGIEADLDPMRTGKVFNVLGDVFPSNQLERMIREMYAHNLTEDVIKRRIVAEVDTERFRRIASSTLEGLAKRELNLSVIVGKTAEARERRLVPEVIEHFFTEAGPLVGLTPKPLRKDGHVYKVGRTPKALVKTGDRLEARFGRIGREYGAIVFDKRLLQDDATLEWVTPGHPLFEAVRADVETVSDPSLRRGTLLYDLHRSGPSRLDVFSAAVKDGRGHVLHRRLFVGEATADGAVHVRQPTLFLDLVPADARARVPTAPVTDLATVERALFTEAMQPLLAEVVAGRERDVATVRRHVAISLNALIDRLQRQYGDLVAERDAGTAERQGLEGRLKAIEDRLDELTARLEARESELAMERECTIADIRHHGSAWVLPHPERTSPALAGMVRDDEVERLAVAAVIAHERARGWEVESVESENRGFDLISRRPHPEDPKTAMAVRFIEVKGRAGVGDVVLTENEHRAAERLRADYWLYVVYHCATTPEVLAHQDPVRLGMTPVVTVQHYRVAAAAILGATP